MSGCSRTSPAASACASLMGGLLIGVSAAFATPAGTPSEDRDHYVPRAGYLRTVEVLALRRGRSIRVASAAPGQVTSLTGRRSIPTILIEFSNVSGSFTSLAYQDHLFGNLGSNPPQATVSQYYRDMSQGQFEVTGRVLGWFRLPQDDRHYEGDDNGFGTGFGEFLTFGLDQADALVDYGEFDNDGPDGLPNSGDDDGIVDMVFFVHPEAGAECNDFGVERNIWSHSWHYSEPAYGHTGMYVTDDVKLDRLQIPELNDDGTEKHIMIEDYTVQPGLACPDPSGIARIVPIGVYAHEYGHALGLPDLYDRTPGNNPDSNGIGDWGVMAGGSWGFGNRPETPTRMSAWSLARLGWARLQILDPAAPVVLDLEPVQERNLVHVVDVPNSNGLEYFLVEFRGPNWTDGMGLRLNWDKDLPHEGLAIWHVDDSVGSASSTWPFAPRDQGQNDAPSLPNSSKHALVALEQADCMLNLERKTNKGDDSDLWRDGQVFGIGNCNGGSVAYDGSATGLSIENIDLTRLSAGLRLAGTPAPPGAPALVASVATEVDVGAAGGTVRPSAPVSSAPVSSAPVVRPAVAGLAAMNARAVATRLERQATLAEANTALISRGDVRSLDVDQRDALVRASVAQIESGVAPAQQNEVKSWVSEQRQRQIEADYEPQNEVEDELKDLWLASGSATPIQAQLDASATRVDRVTGLNLPSTHETLSADADERKETTFKPLLGENVQLAPIASQPEANAQRFQQVHTLDGAELPVFSKGAAFYYDDNRTLKAVAAQTVDAEQLVVTGTPGTLDEEVAREIVVKQLGLSQERAGKLTDAGEGIYLVDDDPLQGRVVQRFSLSTGGDRADIQIFVDATTNAVIAVE